MARPTLLNPARQARIVEALRLGATYRMAAACGGIEYRTLRNWMFRGEQDGEGPYFAFSDAIKGAESEAAISALMTINKAASNGTWQAAAWLLERRHPEEWGKHRTIDRPQLGAYAERLAKERGLPVEDAMREAEKILRERRW